MAANEPAKPNDNALQPIGQHLSKTKIKTKNWNQEQGPSKMASAGVTAHNAPNEDLLVHGTQSNDGQETSDDPVSPVYELTTNLDNIPFELETSDYTN